MTLEEIAEQLIENVGGLVTQQNIDGVMEVFGGIRKGCNNTWEKHIQQQTDDLLFHNKITCSGCDTPIAINYYVDGILTVVEGD